MIEVCAAVIVREPGLVLVARRTRPADLRGLWEFPGGKLEPGESPQECLAREIREELSFAVEVGSFLGESFRWPERNQGGGAASAPNDGEAGAASLRLASYAARPRSGGEGSLPEPKPTDGTHDAIRWVSAAELLELDLAPLDIPHLPAVIGHLGGSPC